MTVLRPPPRWLRRPNWDSQFEQDFTLGIIRDSPRSGIPLGGVYDAENMLLHRPGVAFKRGGIDHPILPVLNGDGLISVSYADFPGIGAQIFVVTNTFGTDYLTGSTRIEHGTLSGFTGIIDPPTLFVGGSHNVLVFCDESGLLIPWFYNGSDEVQQFQGGNTAATGDYDLTISGSPTGGQFKLAAQDLTVGYAYETAAIDWNGAATDVQSALEAAAPASFPCTGGSLPGTPVVITVPVDWAVSWLPPAISGVSLTGGTNPQGSIGPVDGASTGVPTARHSTVHLQRLILANSALNPNRLWFGPLLNPTGSAWDMAESWIDMDQAVTALASLSNVLLVFSNETMWRITGDSPPPDTNMSIQPIGHVGATDARSVVLLEGRCIFASPKGVFITTGVGYESLMKDRIESWWQTLFDGYDPATWTISCGLFGRRFLFVTILNQLDELVKTFVCDIDRRAWTTASRPPAKMYSSAPGVHEILYAASPDTEFLEEVSSFFRPAVGNREDPVTGTFTFTLETRALAAGGGIKAFGDGELLYDLRSEDDTAEVTVDVAAGYEAETFTTAPESPYGETATLDRRRFTVSRDSECVTVRVTGSDPADKAEVYGIQWSVRSYSPLAEGE